MGQYWKGIILKENWKKVKNLVEFSCSSWEFSVGAKLLEHSWIGNHYLDMYIQLLATKYYGYPFVWCGDYCDHMKTSAYKNMEVRVTSRLIEPRKETEILSDDETPEVFNKVIEALEKYIGKDWKCKFNKDNYYTTTTPYNDEAWKTFEELPHVYVDYELDLYEKAGEWIEKNEKLVSDIAGANYEDAPYYKYLVNLDKKEYVIMPKYGPRKWELNPLSLLCANSNDRGGGDLHEEIDNEGNPKDNGYNQVGLWAYDHIGFTNDKAAIKGFKKLVTKFKCDW